MLTNDDWRLMLAESVDRAVRGYDFRVAAFVFMPEHVHLFGYPTTRRARPDLLPRGIKRPFSGGVDQALAPSRPLLVGDLKVVNGRASSGSAAGGGLVR